MLFSSAHYRHFPLADADSGKLLIPFCYQACNGSTRRKGLLGLECLPAGYGLLLNETVVHMAGMRFPLDLVFLDHDLRIVKITPAVQPGLRLRGALRARYTLELPTGEAARAGLRAGQHLRISS